MAQQHLDKIAQMARRRGQPYRVLIVDDEKWVREVFRDFCELTDAFQIELAYDGHDAVSKVKANDYDLVTLDLIMPEMSGLEVLSEIKKASPRVPVMVITGNATDELITEAGVRGACQVMYKPVLLESFIDEITSALDK